MLERRLNVYTTNDDCESRVLGSLIVGSCGWMSLLMTVHTAGEGRGDTSILGSTRNRKANGSQTGAVPPAFALRPELAVIANYSFEHRRVVHSSLHIQIASATTLPQSRTLGYALKPVGGDIYVGL